MIFDSLQVNMYLQDPQRVDKGRFVPHLDVMPFYSVILITSYQFKLGHDIKLESCFISFESIV